MGKRLYILTTDVMMLEGVSDATARRRINEIKDSLGKSEHHKLSIKQYARFNDVDINDVMESIFGKK